MVLLVVTVVAFTAWLIWNLTEKHPIVDLSLFKSRSFGFGTVALCLGYAVFFGNIVLMPLWLQSYLGIYRHLGGHGFGAERHDRRSSPRCWWDV